MEDISLISNGEEASSDQQSHQSCYGSLETGEDKFVTVSNHLEPPDLSDLSAMLTSPLSCTPTWEPSSCTPTPELSYSPTPESSYIRYLPIKIEPLTDYGEENSVVSEKTDAASLFSTCENADRPQTRENADRPKTRENADRPQTRPDCNVKCEPAGTEYTQTEIKLELDVTQKIVIGSDPDDTRLLRLIRDSARMNKAEQIKENNHGCALRICGTVTTTGRPIRHQPQHKYTDRKCKEKSCNRPFISNNKNKCYVDKDRSITKPANDQRLTKFVPYQHADKKAHLFCKGFISLPKLAVDNLPLKYTKSDKSSFSANKPRNAYTEKHHTMKTKVKGQRPGKPRQCSVCNKCFRWPGELAAHLRTHTEEMPYICNICGKGFPEPWNLRRHQRRWPDLQCNMSLTCQTCGKVFSRQGALTKHQDTHLEKKPQAFSENNNHRSSASVRKIQLMCPWCNRVFSRKSDLTKHQRTHSALNSSSTSDKKCENKSGKYIATNLLPKSAGPPPLNCSLCDKKYSRQSGLTKHLNKHRQLNQQDVKGYNIQTLTKVREKPYTCGVCGKAFYTSNHLKRHQRGQLSDKCQQESVELTPIRHPTEKDTVNQEHQCNACQKWFSSHNHLVIHCQTHGTQTTLKSEEPCKTISQESKLNKNQKQYTTEREYRCSPCKKVYKRQCDLTKHQRRHTVNTGKDGEKFGQRTNQQTRTERSNQLTQTEKSNQLTQAKCKALGDPICDREYSRQTTTNKQLQKQRDILPRSTGDETKLSQETSPSPKLNSQQDLRGYKCSLCNKRFIRQFYLRKHLGEKHNPLLNNKVDKGLQQFGDVSNLKADKLLHKDIKQHICVICNKGFAKAIYLYKHTRRHAEETPYKCAACLRRFRSDSALKHHQMAYKCDTYTCEMFQKTFNHPIQLYKHKLTHTEKQPWQCTVCKKGFAQKHSLLRHVKRHAIVKTYKCTTCGKGFMERSDLNRHQRIHLDRNKYECHLCAKTFLEVRYLTRHMSRHSNEKLHECPLCHGRYTNTDTLRKHKCKHHS